MRIWLLFISRKAEYRYKMETSIKIGSGHKLSLKVVTLTLAVSFSIAYSLCVLYGFVFPSKMHTALFETLPWVKWIDPASFIIGLTEFFIAGLFYGAIVVLIYNYFIKRIK